MFSPDLPMNAVQSRKSFRFIMRHLDTRDTQSETMNDLGQRTERRKLFSRKLTRAHLPEVVRVVRLVSTRVRVPAPFSSSGAGFGAGVGRASVFSFRRVPGSSS